jgi:hypothetical protein
VAQRAERDPRIKEQVTKKLSKFVQRGYLAPGSIQSLIKYFPVAKGEDDVRMVFDGSKLGLNSAIWAPSFTLPTFDSLLPMLDVGTWQANIDIIEMFYNYLLDPAIQPYCGVDIVPYLRDGTSQQRLS